MEANAQTLFAEGTKKRRTVPHVSTQLNVFSFNDEAGRNRPQE
jgi:hypothetical protein